MYMCVDGIIFYEHKASTKITSYVQQKLISLGIIVHGKHLYMHGFKLFLILYRLL